MGFGHRVYKSYDPRAKIIKRVADEVFEVTGKNPLLDIALELERIALEDDYFVKRKLYPNVDFYSGLIYQAMGFPVDMFPVLFAIPRTAGWLAQWEEMLTRSGAENRAPASALRRLRPARLRADGSTRRSSWPRDAHRERTATLTRIGVAGLLAAMVAASCAAQPSTAAAGFSGTRALDDVRQLVAIGPRVAGHARRGQGPRLHHGTAEGGRTCRRGAGRSTPSTPRGSVPHGQPAGRHPGHPSSARRPRRSRFSRIIVAGHYDTKLFKEFTFVGANDGGSSAALLIELARALKPRTLPMDVELLFLDGEEAVGEWHGERPHLRQPPLRPGRAEGRHAQDHRRARAGRHDRRQRPADHARVELHALADRHRVERRRQAGPPRVRRRDHDRRGRPPRVPRGRRAGRRHHRPRLPGLAPRRRHARQAVGRVRCRRSATWCVPCCPISPPRRSRSASQSQNASGRLERRLQTGVRSIQLRGSRSSRQHRRRRFRLRENPIHARRRSPAKPRFSSQNTTFDLPDIGPISISCSRPTRLAGTPE